MNIPSINQTLNPNEDPAIMYPGNLQPALAHDNPTTGGFMNWIRNNKLISIIILIAIIALLWWFFTKRSHKIQVEAPNDTGVSIVTGGLGSKNLNIDRTR